MVTQRKEPSNGKALLFLIIIFCGIEAWFLSLGGVVHLVATVSGFYVRMGGRDMGRIYIFILCGLLFGCGATQVNTKAAPTEARALIPVVDKQAQGFIGKSYRVMLDDVFMGVRSSLYDGQILTVSDAKRSQYGSIQILVKDEHGRQAFDKYYAFSDLGLLEEELSPVYVTIDPEKVQPKALGEISHGYGKVGNGNVFKSYVSITKIDGITAYGRYTGLSGIGAQCTDSKVALTYHSNEVISAPNADVSYSIYVDGKDVFSGKGRMFRDSYKSFSFTPNSKFIADALTGKRGAIKVQTLSAAFTRSFYLDGFAEMYTRIKNNCH
jgi:hypothetical protein